jgi:hypothetical protein
MSSGFGPPPAPPSDPVKAFFSRRSSPSFALVSVLALVSLAALSATAFLAAARLERLASRPLADVTRLEMASSTGLAMAMGVLAQAGSTNYGLQRIVTYWRTNEADDLGYLLVGVFTNPANSLEISYLPAFSAASMSNALDPASTQTNASRVSGQGNYRSSAFAAAWTSGLTTNNSTNFPLLGNQTSPLVAWIPIRQERRIRVGSAATTNVQVARMAFFVQDLQGLIDAERMGGSNNRTTGTNPAEISLTNLSGTALMSATTASNFVATNTRRLFASVGALTLSNAGGLATNDLRYVATGLRSWGWMANDANSFSNRIPPGILVAANTGYTNAGQAKFDLNTNLTAGSVGNLVSILSNNLPGFTNRAGGMAGPAYLSNIAANIVDYADADSTPTYFAPDVRGSEAVAWPNEIIYQITFTNSDTLATAGGFQYAFKFKQYVETWNIYNTNVPTVPLSISNNLEILVRIPGTGGNTFTLASLTSDDQKVQVATNVASSPAVLRPGEFGMLETPEQTLVYFADGATNVTNVIFQDFIGNQVLIRGTNSSSAPLTQTLGGMAIYGQTNLGTNLYSSRFSTANQFAFAISDPVLVTRIPRPPPLTVGGDPRAAFFLRSWPIKCSPFVEYASPGGLNWEYGNRSFSNSFVNANSFWADGGRYVTNDLGAYTTLSNSTPVNLYASRVGTWSTNLALARINNSGSFSNVAELGNIYDPIQWADSSQLPSTAGGQRGLWTNLSSAATNDARFCGRNSLRIGRPEFTRFAFTNFGGAGSAAVPNMGMTASAMLDLFRIGSADSNSFTGGGRINLNTAPAPVLAALAGGCRLTNDPALTGVGGSGTNFPIPATMTNAFARGVMKFRQSYPFYSPSQLNFISPDSSWPTNWPTGAVFGNTNPITIPGSGSFLPAGTARLNVTAANDAAMEEWFSKIYGLSGVDSLNFRCYVIAQLTDANGNPRGAPYRKYYQIYTVPYPQTPAFSAVVVEEGSY